MTTDMFEKGYDSDQAYELGFLVAEEGDAVAIRGLVERHGGVVAGEGVLRKLAFSYRIKKHTEGYFGTLRFSMPREKVADLDHDLRLSSPALRHLLLVIPTVQAKPRAPQATEPRRTQQSVPLSNEALERTIEEILQ